MSGKWYVARSTLSLWRSNPNPAITYGFLDDQRLSDLVTYGPNLQNPSEIHGVDEVNALKNSTTEGGSSNWFRWRGSSWYTACITSDWCVAEHDENYEWIVTYFTATLFTAEGVDICTRKNILDENLEKEIIEKMKNNPLLQNFVDQLFSPQRTDV